MRPVRLFDFPFSGNGYKVRLALSMLGIRVDYRIVDILQGQSRTPDFLAKNPTGQIPVLELSDGGLLWESFQAQKVHLAHQVERERRLRRSKLLRVDQR